MKEPIRNRVRHVLMFCKHNQWNIVYFGQLLSFPVEGFEGYHFHAERKNR
jgi:hypothetical protein